MGLFCALVAGPANLVVFIWNTHRWYSLVVGIAAVASGLHAIASGWRLRGALARRTAPPAAGRCPICERMFRNHTDDQVRACAHRAIAEALRGRP
jgi:hypothetical protein